jgi:hypothetical protein
MSINIATANDLLEAFSKLRTCCSMVVIKHSDGSASFEPSSFKAEPGIDVTKNKDSVGRSSDTEVVDLVSPAKIKDPTGHSGAEVVDLSVEEPPAPRSRPPAPVKQPAPTKPTVPAKLTAPANKPTAPANKPTAPAEPIATAKPPIPAKPTAPAIVKAKVSGGKTSANPAPVMAATRTSARVAKKKKPKRIVFVEEDAEVEPEVDYQFSQQIELDDPFA